MRFIPFTEQNWNLLGFWSDPESGPELDPEADPRIWIRIRIKMNRIRNTNQNVK